MKKNILIIFSITFLIIIPLTNAVSIGVSPGKINLDNLLRGGYAERSIKISTNSENPVVTSLTPGGDLAKWLRFEPENHTFIMSSNNPFTLKIIVEPPMDARSGTYTGKINFVTERFGEVEGRAGGFVKVGVTFLINVIIADEEIVECSAGAFRFGDIEENFPLEISFNIQNGGNVRITPLMGFDIWDQEQKRIVLSGNFISPEVLPTTNHKVVKNFPHNLPIGQYWVETFIDECESRDLLTFSIVEKGGIIDEGILERINHKLWGYVDEPLEIKSIFRNNGKRSVSAKFKGDITLNNEIIKVIETEEIDVPTQEIGELISYFTPKESGRYIIKGRVFYNRKTSFEKSSILNINHRNYIEKGIDLVPLLIYLAILVTIFFLIRKIIITKKQKKFRK